MASSHGICVPQKIRVDEVGVNTTIYVVSFPKVLQRVIYPMPGLPAVAHSAGRLCKHFMYQHFRSKVEVVQEGREPLLRCELCGIYMPAGRLIKHRNTVRCDKNTQIRCSRQDVAIVARFLEATFSLTGEEEAERI